MKRIWCGVYFLAQIGQIIVRIPYDRQRRAIAKTERRVTLVERGLLGGLAVSFLITLVYALTPRLDFANYPISQRLSRWIGSLGTVVLGTALWVFWRSHHDLGANWSPSLEINARQRLVTDGIYESIRHPMYASHLLWGIGQACLLQNRIAGWTGIATFLALYLARVPSEERMMLDHFGDEYRAYASRTGRILPRWLG